MTDDFADDKLSKTELELEDQIWERFIERNEDYFAALKVQALVEIAEGKAIDMFDENGDFALGWL